MVMVAIVHSDMDVPDSPCALLCLRKNDQKSTREQLSREHRQGKLLNSRDLVQYFAANIVIWLILTVSY